MLLISVKKFLIRAIENERRRGVVLFGTNLFHIIECVLVPNLVSLMKIFRCLGRIILGKTCDESNAWLGIWCIAAEFILPSPKHWKLHFYKNLRLYIIGWSHRNEKISAYLQLAKNRKVLPKVWQKLLFNQHSQSIYEVVQKQIENLEIVQEVNFEVFDSLNYNGKRYLLIFGNFCDETCNWKAYVDIATAWRYHGLSVIYIKHSLCNQIK